MLIELIQSLMPEFQYELYGGKNIILIYFLQISLLYNWLVSLLYLMLVPPSRDILFGQLWIEGKEIKDKVYRAIHILLYYKGGSHILSHIRGG